MEKLELLASYGSIYTTIGRDLGGTKANRLLGWDHGISTMIMDKLHGHLNMMNLDIQRRVKCLNSGRTGHKFYFKTEPGNGNLEEK